jgi:hypothetical protein
MLPYDLFGKTVLIVGFGRIGTRGLKRLRSTLDIKTNCIYHAISAGESLGDRLCIMDICFDRFKLGIVGPEQLAAATRMSRCNANEKLAPTQMPNYPAAKKAGPAKHNDKFVCVATTVHFSTHLAVWLDHADVGYSKCLLIAIYRMDNLIEMRIDFVRQLIEVTPLLAKFGRFMRRSQQIPILPLNVVDDAPPIQAAVQADGHESGLPRHETGTLGHQRQSLCLLLRLGLDNCDLCYGLFVGSNVRHGRPRLHWKPLYNDSRPSSEG